MAVCIPPVTHCPSSSERKALTANKDSWYDAVSLFSYFEIFIPLTHLAPYIYSQNMH